VVPRTRVTAIRSETGGFVVEADSAGEASRLRCAILVNAAGLAATAVAERVDGLPPDARPATHYAIGHYYAHSGRLPFRHLIYPLPDAAGLGVHLTLDLGGDGRFGPDVRWRERVDHAFDDGERATFVAAIRRWWPGLDPDRLVPGYTGIRPKLVGPGEPAADFRIVDGGEHGVPGYLGLHGIESPGLTASLALGDLVADRLAPA
jgi:L-2-hydroxyglutarate oxidase LhgO